LRGTVLGHGILIVGNAKAFPSSSQKFIAGCVTIELKAQGGIFRADFTG
jgi:hypothetical protein